MNKAKLRLSRQLLDEIENICFSRYPDDEWGLLFNFGYTWDREHGLLLTLTNIIKPEDGEINGSVPNIQFLEPYILRAGLSMQESKLAIGAIHSHPEGYAVTPSLIDDDMDKYFSEYFSSFGDSRPYASLIIGRRDTRLLISGRVYFRGRWMEIEKFSAIGPTISSFWPKGAPRSVSLEIEARLERFTGILGKDSAQSLWNSSVVVVGSGGTGSAAIHSLARSCVGRIVIVDSDFLEKSNSERIHGIEDRHLRSKTAIPKVSILKDFIKKINPNIEVIAFHGNALHEEVYSELIHADLILGCTDTQHGRALVSELSYRYLVPGILVNVVMESHNKRLSGQVLQLTRYRVGQPCAYCRSQIDSRRLSQELMPENERSERQILESKRKSNAYWLEEPTLHTVGSLTTIAGELASNYAIGMLTDRYSCPDEFMEINLLGKDLSVTSVPLDSHTECVCSARQGFSDQTPEGKLLLAPSHWKRPKRI